MYNNSDFQHSTSTLFVVPLTHIRLQSEIKYLKCVCQLAEVTVCVRMAAV